MKKLFLVLALGIGIVGMAAILTQPAAADSRGEYPGIVQKLVDRFGLNADEVKEIFDQDREERRGQMMARFEERLNQAVAEGKITESQEEAILAKKAELQAQHQEMGQEMAGLSVEERRQEMEKHREEMEAWMQQHGIDPEYLMGFGGKFGHRGGPCPGE
jgi:hypothetical protein